MLNSTRFNHSLWKKKSPTLALLKTHNKTHTLSLKHTHTLTNSLSHTHTHKDSHRKHWYSFPRFGTGEMG